MPKVAWLLAAVPLLGLVELGLHAKQTSDVVPDEDWAAAREAVKAELRPDDLVLFAPFWTDPVGRQRFGDEIVTMKRAAFGDVTRFARAFEVSIRGGHREEIAGFRKVSERRFGQVTVGIYENPSARKVLTELVDLVGPETMSVARVDGDAETPCTFQRGSTAGGTTVVPQGMLVPAAKFVCPGGGHVGVAVQHALDHKPHLCINAPPVGGATLRVRFSNVTFGSALHGHDGSQWVTERTPSAERVTLSLSAFDRPIGEHVHRVGAGWTGFELPTEELAGKKGELVADISGGPGQRYYCFEGDTRE